MTDIAIASDAVALRLADLGCTMCGGSGIMARKPSMFSPDGKGNPSFDHGVPFSEAFAHAELVDCPWCVAKLSASIPNGGQAWRQELFGSPIAQPSLPEAEKRYREFAMQFHPDRGGDPARFRRINDAIEQARAEFASSAQRA